MSQLKRLAWLGNFANEMNSITADITVRQTIFHGGHHQICWNCLNFSCLSVTKIKFHKGSSCSLIIYLSSVCSTSHFYHIFSQTQEHWHWWICLQVQTSEVVQISQTFSFVVSKFWEETSSVLFSFRLIEPIEKMACWCNERIDVDWLKFAYKQVILLDLVLFGKDNVPFDNMGYAACPK